MVLVKEDNVDIYQHPAVDAVHKSDHETQLTIGDLHANAMKFLHFLIRQGVISNMSEYFFKLVILYTNPRSKATKKTVDEFLSYLAKAVVKPVGLIRLIGDELGDRGANDYYVLKIIELLRKNNVPMEILLSNHGVEFIRAYEKYHERNTFASEHLWLFGQANSSDQLNQFVENKIVTKEEIFALADKYYKPCLRAISYSISPDGETISIYSHAAIGLGEVKAVADSLSVIYQDETLQALAETIDAINKVFYEQYVSQNTVHLLCTSDAILACGDGYAIDPKNSPFCFLMWNRNYHNLIRPSSYSGYKLQFFHGHDSREATNGNIINLDSYLGKFVDKLFQGAYRIYHSRDSVARYQPENIIAYLGDVEANRLAILNLSSSEEDETEVVVSEASVALAISATNAQVQQEDNLQLQNKPSMFCKPHFWRQRRVQVSASCLLGLLVACVVEAALIYSDSGFDDWARKAMQKSFSSMDDKLAKNMGEFLFGLAGAAVVALISQVIFSLSCAKPAEEVVGEESADLLTKQGNVQAGYGSVA